MVAKIRRLTTALTEIRTLPTTILIINAAVADLVFWSEDFPSDLNFCEF